VSDLADPSAPGSEPASRLFSAFPSRLDRLTACPRRYRLTYLADSGHHAARGRT
jgi:hypothetical protein